MECGKISIAPGTGAVEVAPRKNASPGFPKGEMIYIPSNWWPNHTCGKGFIDTDRDSAYMLHKILVDWS